MSSSGEVTGQIRPIDTHVPYGERFSIDGTRRKMEVIPSPNKDNCPIPESKKFTRREGVHKFHDYQPSSFIKRNKCGIIPEGTEPHQRTRVRGTNKRTGWKVNQPTKNYQRRVEKSKKWSERFDKGSYFPKGKDSPSTRQFKQSMEVIK